MWATRSGARVFVAGAGGRRADSATSSAPRRFRAVPPFAVARGPKKGFASGQGLPLPGNKARCVLEPARSSGEGAGAETAEEITLPVFPLSMVAIPSCEVPLHIFEARYRILFNTLLYGEDDVDEGLANTESPFVGTKQFGMCYVDKEGNIASVGSVLEIGEHQQLDDGRLYIQNTAVRRFNVTEVVEEAPVLICRVKLLDDDRAEDENPENVALARDVVEVFQKALALGSSVDSSPEPPKPEQLSLPLTELAFWLTSLFPQDPQEQQLMLQIDTTRERLERLKEIFEATYNYHVARNSIKSALSDE